MHNQRQEHKAREAAQAVDRQNPDSECEFGERTVTKNKCKPL